MDQVESVELTYKQVQDRYDIQGSLTVLKWLRRYGHPDWHPGSTTHQVRKTAMPEFPPILEQRIKKLEQELRLAEQKTQFF